MSGIWNEIMDAVVCSQLVRCSRTGVAGQELCSTGLFRGQRGQAQRLCCMKGAYQQKLMQFSSFVTKRPGHKLYRNGTRWYKRTVQQRLKDTTSWNSRQSTMLEPEYTWPVLMRRRKGRRKCSKPCNSFLLFPEIWTWPPCLAHNWLWLLACQRFAVLY